MPQIEIGSKVRECECVVSPLHRERSQVMMFLGDSHGLSEKLTGIPPFVVVPDSSP